MAPYYNPDNNDNTGPSEVTIEGKCYTLWLFENDITHLHSMVSGTIHDTTHENSRLSKEKAVDGYSCDMFDGHFYHSIHDPQNYLELQFPMHVRVTSVFVKTRMAGYPSFFVNMEVRVGNYSGLGNVGSNSKIGNTVTSTIENELVRFDATSNPVVGTSVIIHQVASSGILVMQEMKVIGHVV